MYCLGLLQRFRDVDARKHAITTNISVNNRFAAIISKLLGQIDDIMATELAPTVCGDFAISGIQPHDNVPRKSGAGIAQKPWVFNRGRTDDDILDTEV